MAETEIPDEAVGTFNDNWRRCVGTGNLSLALHHEYLRALELVQEAIGFDYIRGHGLLSDRMGVCRNRPAPDSHERDENDIVTNFTYVDRVFDACLARGIRPFVELGFTPANLASGDTSIFWWKGLTSPPRDYGLWRKLISELVEHLLKRYGEEEVHQWPFEVWNEPDVGFWSGTQEEYFRLYRETAGAIRDVDPAIRVGGPSTCPAGIDWIEPFLAMCEDSSTPADFVTTHSYYAGGGRDNRGEFCYQQMNPREHALEQFEYARRLIDESPYPDLALHITEYNTSYSPIGPIHDTPYNAAFLGWLLSRGGDVAESFSYWTFCDVFEEQDIPRSLFHGGFGLVAAHGIPKPTFHLFAFFAALGEELLHRDDEMIVTRRGDGSLAIVAWHPVENPAAGGERRRTLSVPVPAEEVLITRRRSHEEAGNAWGAWRTMGRPRYPGDDQVSALLEAAQPDLELTRGKADAGRLSLPLTLERNEVTLIEVAPLDDQTLRYLGLDDGRIPGYTSGQG